jgi:hypothetical protein
MSLILVKDGNEPMVHEAMAYVESLGIPAAQIRRITVDAKVGQPLVVGLELFVPEEGAEPERKGFLFGADVHGGSSDGYGSVSVEDCRWPDERCHGHWRGPGIEPQKSHYGAPDDNDSDESAAARTGWPENGCPRTGCQKFHSGVPHTHHSADDVACSGEREGICSGGPAHHPDCPSAQPRKLIGPPHAHLDAPCTDACYEAAETVLWIDQDGKGHTAVPGLDMTDMGWTLA